MVAIQRDQDRIGLQVQLLKLVSVAGQNLQRIEIFDAPQRAQRVSVLIVRREVELRNGGHFVRGNVLCIGNVAAFLQFGGKGRVELIRHGFWTSSFRYFGATDGHDSE